MAFSEQSAGGDQSPVPVLWLQVEGDSHGCEGGGRVALLEELTGVLDPLLDQAMVQGDDAVPPHVVGPELGATAGGVKRLGVGPGELGSDGTGQPGGGVVGVVQGHDLELVAHIGVALGQRDLEAKQSRRRRASALARLLGRGRGVAVGEEVPATLDLALLGALRLWGARAQQWGRELQGLSLPCGVGTQGHDEAEGAGDQRVSSPAAHLDCCSSTPARGWQWRACRPAAPARDSRSQSRSGRSGAECR